MAITTLNNRSINRSDTAASGQLWTATSATASDFQAVSAGKILQVVMGLKTDTTTIASATPAAISGLTVAITPAATSSKVLVQVSIGGIGQTNVDQKIYFTITGGNTATYVGDSATGYECASVCWIGQASYGEQHAQMMYLDSPSTTSEITYGVNWWTSGTGTGYLNRTSAGGSGSGNTASTIIATEVGA